MMGLLSNVFKSPKDRIGRSTAEHRFNPLLNPVKEGMAPAAAVGDFNKTSAQMVE